jgi:hypothetical protein
MTSSSIFWRMKQMPGARTYLGFQNIIFHASQAKKIIDHRWRVAFWMTCHTQVRLYVCSISSLFIIIILLAEVVFPIECFKMRNTCCLCMTYCNSLLWFIDIVFVQYNFIKYFVYSFYTSPSQIPKRMMVNKETCVPLV